MSNTRPTHKALRDFLKDFENRSLCVATTRTDMLNALNFLINMLPLKELGCVDIGSEYTYIPYYIDVLKKGLFELTDEVVFIDITSHLS